MPGGLLPNRHLPRLLRRKTPDRRLSRGNAFTGKLREAVREESGGGGPLRKGGLIGLFVGDCRQDIEPGGPPGRYHRGDDTGHTGRSHSADELAARQYETEAFLG